MTTALAPMSEAAFGSFRERAVADYARDNVQAGRWPEAEAPSRAHDEFQRLLPQGLATPNHHLYEIRDTASRQVVGAVWFMADAANGSGYLYNIRVEPAFRGRGHAKAALDLIEETALGMGLSAIGLHVFAHNTTAQALYRASGYWITGLHMRKPLRPPSGA